MIIMDQKAKSIRLKVQEGKEEFIGKNIVTLNIAVKQALGVLSGDVVEIVGDRKTCAQVWPEKGVAGEENIIKMDQYIRRNAGVSTDDFVTVRRIQPKVAEQIVLSPLKDVNFFSDNYDLIVKKSFLGRPFCEGDTILINVFGTGFLFLVASTTPKDCVILSEVTNLVVNSKQVVKVPEKAIIGYEDVGGLKKEMDTIKEMVELPFKYPDLFKKLNIRPPKGILMYGPPGTGKTLLAKALSNELKANFIAIDAPQIMAKYVGEAEERLRKIFKVASQKVPAIIFIDEIDAIAPKRDSFVTEVEKRVVAQLLALMDGINDRGDIIVIGATNRQDDIDPALRRPGRFDREIDIGIPNDDGRLEILKIHTRNVPLSKDVDLKLISEVTHGFVGADLSALIKEAAIIAIKNSVKDVTLENKEIPLKIIEELKICRDDFIQALKVIQPSALREVYVDTPNIDLEDVGGLDKQKELMDDIISTTLKNKTAVIKMNIKPLKKLLLYGPPGTGKTMFVKACAKAYGVNFVYVKGPEVLDKWVGQSEKMIRGIFKKAKDVSPCILFFDEIDSLTLDKQGNENQPKVLDQLLTELDNIDGKDIIFIAATNRVDLVDKSFLRSGRIDRLVEFNVPDASERKGILEVLLRKIPSGKINIKEIVENTEEFTGADLALLVSDAAMLALKENNYVQTKLMDIHISKTLKKMKPVIMEKHMVTEKYIQ